MLNSQKKKYRTQILCYVGMLTQPEMYLKTGRTLQARQDVPGSFLLCPKTKKEGTVLLPEAT